MILFIIIYVSVSKVTLSWRELQGSQCPFLQHMSLVPPLANVTWGSPTAPASSLTAEHTFSCTDVIPLFPSPVRVTHWLVQSFSLPHPLWPFIMPTHSGVAVQISSASSFSLCQS